jgi:protein-histidine N-methyltransferase
MSFSFSFAGDDIEETTEDLQSLSISTPPHAAETGTLSRNRSSSTAFPVAGQPLIPAKSHTLEELLASLPSTISYGTLKVELDDDSELKIPRRELWDVRVQLMAEDEEVGLGKDDVKTGVYEGGFKSWESSVDLVRELAKLESKGKRFLEVCHVGLLLKEDADNHSSDAAPLSQV